MKIMHLIIVLYHGDNFIKIEIKNNHNDNKK
jgi:hypothetical protein